MEGLIEAIRLPELLGAAFRALWLLILLVFVIFLLELRAGADPRRYLSLNFVNDVFYTLFYSSRIYEIFVVAAIVNALGSRLDFLEIGLLSGIPSPIDFIAYWLIVDFLGYWVHRLEHSVPFLWAFHSVHHSQEQMTALTTFRNHPVSLLLARLVVFGPLLILGIPTRTWFLLYALQQGFEYLQHSALRWGYGGMYKVVVSPLFHAFHHSAAAQHHHRNFGKILSVWDFVFGTAVTASEPRPERSGVEGLGMRESLLHQFVLPFIMAWRSLRGRPATVTPARPRPPS